MASAKAGGDFSPPGFSLETLDEAQAALLAWANAWREGQDGALPTPPSAAFGISCALAELGGELPLAADYRAAPLCSGDPDELFARLSQMPGEKVAKVKVGLYEAVRDGMVVNLLLEAIPDLTLRLDANRAWTPLKAQQFAKYVSPHYRTRIAFLEEPCKTAMIRARLPNKRASLSPGMRACAKRTLRLLPSRVCARW